VWCGKRYRDSLLHCFQLAVQKLTHSTLSPQQIKSSLVKILGALCGGRSCFISLSASSASLFTTTHQMTYAPAGDSILEESIFSCALALKKLSTGAQTQCCTNKTNVRKTKSNQMKN
jgi:hypothetical protein